MGDDPAMLETSIDDFFLRAGLAPQAARLDCYALIEGLYSGEPISPASCQGYCSMTVFVGDAHVVQFRPYRYRLDLRIAQAAREIYGPFAPDTKYLGTLPSSGLLAYSMNRIEGISFRDFRSGNTTIMQSTEHRMRLCRGFAAFLSRGWLNNNTNIPLGTVGLSIVSRLKSLVTELPLRFQSTARNVLRQLHRIEALPWVLTHGDIVAANIMVEPSSGSLFGFVDWAEAERLPFGICLYGLEEILGEMTPTGFRYHPDADDLRDLFWADLKKEIPELQQTHVLEAVKMARDLGVLLWHGIAFDNGAIDRVVQEDRDIDEIHRLDAFLVLQEQQDLDKASKTSFPISCAINTTPALGTFPRDSQRSTFSSQ